MTKFTLFCFLGWLVIMTCSSCSKVNTENNGTTQLDTSNYINTTRDMIKNHDTTDISDEYETTDMTDILNEPDAFDETVMPDDFYFVFESSGGEVMLDTKNNIIGKIPAKGGCIPIPKHLIIPGMFDYVSTDYYISNDNLQEIYFSIIKYNIREFASHNEDDSDLFLWMIHDYCSTANYQMKIKFFVDGNLYSVWFDSSILGASDDRIYAENHLYSGLILFVRYLWDFYSNTEEYKSFPEYLT